jgi:hypothetical protein
MSSTVTVWMGGPIHCIEITRMLRVVFFTEKNMKTCSDSKLMPKANSKMAQNV